MKQPRLPGTISTVQRFSKYTCCTDRRPPFSLIHLLHLGPPSVLLRLVRGSPQEGIDDIPADSHGILYLSCGIALLVV